MWTRPEPLGSADDSFDAVDQRHCHAIPNTACEPGKAFGFEVLVGDRPVNNWHYRFTPTDGGTDVTESFRMNDSVFTKVFAVLGGLLRTRRNKRDMRKTLERIKAVVEAPA